MATRNERRIVVYNLMSLDGYFEGNDPWAIDFHHSVVDDEFEAFSLAQCREAGTLLFGRRTYEGMADYWRSKTDPIANMMNSLEKVVATRTLETVDWPNTRLLKGDAVKHARTLKAERGKKDIFIFGSANLVADLLSEGLVDEYRLCLVPVVLGGGEPLFKPDGLRKNFELTQSDTLKSGGVLLRYMFVDSTIKQAV